MKLPHLRTWVICNLRSPLSGQCAVPLSLTPIELVDPVPHQAVCLKRFAKQARVKTISQQTPLSQPPARRKPPQAPRITHQNPLNPVLGRTTALRLVHLKRGRPYLLMEVRPISTFRPPPLHSPLPCPEQHHPRPGPRWRGHQPAAADHAPLQRALAPATTGDGGPSS